MILHVALIPSGKRGHTFLCIILRFLAKNIIGHFSLL